MIKHKKYTVTIGIPTYNEEHNISHLLTVIRNQRQEFVDIKKIHIVDDGSNDNTIANIRKIKDKRIVLTQRGKRLGQASAQNYIFDSASTDFVLILEADTFPTDNFYIDNIIQPFLQNSEVGLIQGNMKPLPSTSLLGKVLNTHFAIFTKFIINNDAFPTPITSGRGGRLFSKRVYKELRWPNAVPEDDYASVWCKKYDITTSFSRAARCYYQRPQALTDYLKERRKVNCAEDSISKHFSRDVMNKYFEVPFKMTIKMMLYFMIRYPITFLLYLGLVLVQFIVAKGYFYTDFWPETKSTKVLLPSGYVSG